MNKRKIMYSILKEIDEGNKEPKAKDYGISTHSFGSIVKMMQDDNLINGAAFSETGSEILIVFLNTAKITIKGMDYLEENSSFNKTYKGLKEIRDWLK